MHVPPPPFLLLLFFFFLFYLQTNPECTIKNGEVPYNKNMLLFRSVTRYGHMLNYVLYFHIYLRYKSQCFWAQTLQKQVEGSVWLYSGNWDQVLALVYFLFHFLIHLTWEVYYEQRIVLWLPKILDNIHKVSYFRLLNLA